PDRARLPPRRSSALEQCEAAIDAGARMVRAAGVLGCNLVALGEMGIGNTTSAAALMGSYTGLAVESCVGRGGVADAHLAQRHQVDRKSTRLNSSHRT